MLRTALCRFFCLQERAGRHLTLATHICKCAPFYFLPSPPPQGQNEFRSMASETVFETQGFSVCLEMRRWPGSTQTLSVIDSGMTWRPMQSIKRGRLTCPTTLCWPLCVRGLSLIYRHCGISSMNIHAHVHACSTWISICLREGGNPRLCHPAKNPCPLLAHGSTRLKQLWNVGTRWN